MTSLADLYQTIDAKDATLSILVGGVPLTDVWEASWTFAIGTVPTATIRVPNPPPGVAQFFANVQIDAGFNGVTTRCFTGKVLQVNSDERGTNIECVGKSWPLDVHFQSIVKTFDNITAQQAIIDLLDDAGIVDYEVNMPAWTIGTAVVQTLEFQTYSEAIRKVAEVDGADWYELPTGTVRVEPRDPLPSLEVWREYFSMRLTGLVEAYPADVTPAGRPRLRQMQMAERIREVKNRVVVRGATYTQTATDGTETTLDIESTVSVASPWVLFPDGTQAYNTLLFSNELIDTQVKADEVAARLATLHARLTWQGQGVVDGDPEEALARTLRIEDPDYSGASGRWYLEGYETRLTGSDFVTNLTGLRRAEGGPPNVPPFALFTYAVDREVIGDRVYAIVTLDGRSSYDTDGSIVSYLWSDNQTPQIATGTDAVITVRADPATLVTPWLVTLQVTDNNGATDDVTLTVDIALGAPNVYIPAIYVAFDNNFSASLDGGQTWNDQGGVGVISVDAKPGDPFSQAAGFACFGTEAGAIYRTTDGCRSAPALALVAVGSPIAHIHWDRQRPTEAWAVAQDGRVYRSQDDGLSWALYDNLANLIGPSLRLNRVTTLPGLGVCVFGGDGAGQPVIAYDRTRDHSWQVAAVGGELANDLGAGGPADLFIFDFAVRERGELAIILNSATFTPAVYYTSDILGDGSAWRRALAVPGKPRGRWLEPDLQIGDFALAFNDAVNYLGDVAAGVMTVSVAAAALDAGDAPNHGLWIGSAIPGIAYAYLVATEGTADGTVYKTWDRFASIAKLRPATGFPAAPAGANAKMVAIGPQGEVSPLTGRVVFPYTLTSPKAGVSWRLDDPQWNHHVFPTEFTGQGFLLTRAITATLWFVIGKANVGAWPSIVQRTKDAGAIWGALPVQDADYYWQDFARDAAGRLWGLAYNTALFWHAFKVYYSDDEGDSWTTSLTVLGTVSFIPQYVIRIVTHPTNPNTIAVLGMRGVLAGLSAATWYTTDRGASWAQNLPAFTNWALEINQHDAVMTVDGRIVAVKEAPSLTPDIHIYTSDDFGATWVLRHTFGSPSFYAVNGPTSNIAGDRLYVVANGPAVGERHVFRSVNSGNTWQQMNNDPIANAGVAYDGFDDVLYLFLSSGGLPNANLVQRMSPAGQSGTWEDFTDALLPINGETSYVSDIGSAMSVIPR